MDWDAVEYALRIWTRDFAPDLAEALFDGESDLTWDDLTGAFIDSYEYFMSK